MIEMEIWKDVVGYEGLYQVSDLGRVKSLRSKVIMKPQKSNSGYDCVMLYGINSRRNSFIHRLVAISFIINPENLPQVNHKDLNRNNNLISNLEWCNGSENQKHSYDNSNRRSGMLGRTGLMNSTSKPVLMVSLGGIVIRKFNSQAEAQRETGILSSKISLVVNGIRKSAGKHYWKSI